MSSNKNDFKPFTVGGLTPSHVASNKPAAAPSLPPRSIVAPEDRVFPHIEEMLEGDQSQLDQLADSMKSACEALDSIIEQRSGRIKEEAEKIKKAYVHTTDLVLHLLETKAAILGIELEEK